MGPLYRFGPLRLVTPLLATVTVATCYYEARIVAVECPSVRPSVRLCFSLSHRSTAAAAAGGFAAEVWRGQQVLPFLSEYRATRFLHLWQSLSTLFAPPLHLTPMPYRSSANVLVSVMEYWEEQLRRGCLQSSVCEIEGNKAVRSGERRL